MYLLTCTLGKFESNWYQWMEFCVSISIYGFVLSWSYHCMHLISPHVSWVVHWPVPDTCCGIQRTTLRWRHNDQDGVSNHQPHGCLLNRLFRRRSNKKSKLRVTGLCVGNSPGPVNSPHKGPVTRKMFPFDDVIMKVIQLAAEICLQAKSGCHPGDDLKLGMKYGFR